jgi:pyrimidine deaminase RibD-like protein
MRRALLLARRGWGRTAPNPMVGAVVVRDGVVVGEGWHDAFGGPHAEVVALAAAGERARGADVYVTLEPCAHHGKTPPCVDALIAAGVRRVIVAVPDPNPVASGGMARLRAAGIAVTDEVETAAAAELNAPFLFAQRDASRPFVTLKLAVSLDGGLAPGDRSQRWLTGVAARRHVHRLRGQRRCGRRRHRDRDRGRPRAHRPIRAPPPGRAGPRGVRPAGQARAGRAAGPDRPQGADLGPRGRARPGRGRRPRVERGTRPRRPRAQRSTGDPPGRGHPAPPGGGWGGGWPGPS